MNFFKKNLISENSENNLKSQGATFPHKGAVNFFFVFLIILSFIFGTLFGLANSKNLLTYVLGSQGGKVINNQDAYKYTKVDFNELFDIWNLIKNNYLNKDQITDTQLFYGAMAGSVASLNDPYSIFLNPNQAKEFSDELKGSIEGIGAELGIKKNILTVITAIDGGPAQKAGLESGDQILSIDNVETMNMTLDEAITKIRGESGTIVALGIKRNSNPEFLTLKIKREKIEVDSVRWKTVGNNIAHIEISGFNQDTSAKFRQAVSKILATNPKGLILDLRSNPGGYLDTAVDVASYWIESGVVVKEDYGDPKKNNDYQAKGNAKLKEFKTVVLINNGSASASEIVAGALQDYKLASLVGEKTFGKGTVQDLTDLPDGSAIKLTIARWLTPNGRSIEENGITPDWIVDLTKDDYDNNRDPQLDKAIELINEANK